MVQICESNPRLCLKLPVGIFKILFVQQSNDAGTVLLNPLFPVPEVPARNAASHCGNRANQNAVGSHGCRIPIIRMPANQPILVIGAVMDQRFQANFPENVKIALVRFGIFVIRMGVNVICNRNHSPAAVICPLAEGGHHTAATFCHRLQKLRRRGAGGLQAHKQENGLCPCAPIVGILCLVDIAMQPLDIIHPLVIIGVVTLCNNLQNGCSDIRTGPFPSCFMVLEIVHREAILVEILPEYRFRHPNIPVRTREVAVGLVIFSQLIDSFGHQVILTDGSANGNRKGPGGGFLALGYSSRQRHLLLRIRHRHFAGIRNGGRIRTTPGNGTPVCSADRQVDVLRDK